MKRSHHAFLISLAISTCVVMYCILAPSVLPRLAKLRQKANFLRTEIAALEQENQNLESQIKLLAGDSVASREHLKKLAREELGLVAKDEFLVVLDSK